jgi:putative flippase GtrA
MWSAKWSIAELAALIDNTRQPIIFSLIGFLNSLIHFGVYLIVLKILGGSYLASSIVGYCSGVVNSYVLNRKLTFRVDRGQSLPEFFRFVAVNICSLSLNLTLLTTFVELFRLTPELSQIYSILVSMTLNFVGNKYWTFRRQ